MTIPTLAKLALLLFLAALVPVCVVLTFEGDLFFLPAAVVLLLAALQEWRAGRHVTT